LNKDGFPRRTLANEYLIPCQTEGKTPKTLRRYREKLLRFVLWFDTAVGELPVQKAREFVAGARCRRELDRPTPTWPAIS